MNQQTTPDGPVLLGCIPQDPAARDLLSRVTGRDCVPYRDSVAGVCRRCNSAVWVGPMQQRVLAARPGSVTVCMPCAAVLASTGGLDVRSLSAKQWGE